MATILPPPSKRQRVAALTRSGTQQSVETPELVGSVKIQFRDTISGLPIGDGPILVPASEVNTKSLELLLNTLQSNDSSSFIKYKFTINTPKSGNSANAPPTEDLLRPEALSFEEVNTVNAAPQAVFRVQAVSRCGSTIPGHRDPILAAQFSPRSSSRMVTGSSDGTARIWDCDTGTPVFTLTGHANDVLAVSWSPDDSRIATGAKNGEVRLWDPKTGKQIGSPMLGHKGFVTSLCWEPYHTQTPGEPRLASSSKDHTVRIWATNQQRIQQVLSGHKDSVKCVKWGGIGLIYTASIDRTIKVWNANEGTLVQTLTSHTARINHLALSTDFALRTAYHDHTGKIPASDEEKIAKAKARYLTVATISGEVVERLASASDDLTVCLWEPSSKGSTKPIARMFGHQKPINHVTFSPDRTLIASSSFDNHTKLWRAQDGKFVNTLRGHVGAVYQCCFSPDSRLLVTGSKDTTLKVWDMGTHKLSNDLPGHQGEVYAVDWSPDGEKVGSGGADKAVRIWRH